MLRRLGDFFFLGMIKNKIEIQSTSASLFEERERAQKKEEGKK